MHTPARRLGSATLPPEIADLEVPPRCIFLTGELGPRPRVALVGTRRPTPEAEKYTHRFAAQLAFRGVTVVSGGAVGVDAAAHRGALSQGVTLVVAPCGFERPYPAEHAELFRQIVAGGGGYLTERESDHVARRSDFFRRNALLVALADVVVLVQAPFRSGARNAALWARRLGRPLLVMPGPPWCSRSLGSNLEIASGARPCHSIRDVAELLSARGLLIGPEETPPPPVSTRAAHQQLHLPDGGPAAPALTELAGQVLEQLGPDTLHLDELCARTGAPSGLLQGTVTELVLRGDVTVLPGGLVRRAEERGAG